VKRIIVVDDSEMVRNFHCFVLRSNGYEVISAFNGVDALKKIYKNKVDMIITDVTMPIMDGYSFIKRIRMEKELKDIPIIIISTEDKENNKYRGFNTGANLFINKPTDPKKLVESVNMLFGERQYVEKH